MESKNFNKLLNQYNYSLPETLIAQTPAKPRDSAKLLIFNQQTHKTQFDTFKNLGKHLPKNAVLVFNQTKVLPARFLVKKATGGVAELLFLRKKSNSIFVLANKPLTGTLTCLNLRKQATLHKLRVIAKAGGEYQLQPINHQFDIFKTLQKIGITPLPPYIKHSPLSEKQKRQEYQAIFAKTGQAVAAPTASLHFTQKLIRHLKERGIGVKFIRLDVGLGTFAPLKTENFLNNQLHSEYYFIDKATAKFLNQAKKQHRPIIAVGTTVVRTLETATNAQGYLQNLTGSSNLFIQKDYQFKFINGLITNFHVPKSSLMMLVGSLVGRKTLLNLYQKAIAKNFRFFSFGDGMLIK
jgi:S-adenosylmethionine:tRNA ribosyltransferase-isomerase